MLVEDTLLNGPDLTLPDELGRVGNLSVAVASAVVDFDRASQRQILRFE
jgi:hypothetical protein